MANDMVEFKKAVEEVVKEQYNKKEFLELVEERKQDVGYCVETAQMLANTCTDILYGPFQTGTEEEWKIIEREIDKYMPPS